LVAAAKFLVAGTKKLFVVPNFVAVTKPFFSVVLLVQKVHCPVLVAKEGLAMGKYIDHGLVARPELHYTFRLII